MKPEYIEVDLPDSDGRIVVTDPQLGKRVIIDVKDGKGKIKAEDLPTVEKLPRS
jgi:hypothetical protein